MNPTEELENAIRDMPLPIYPQQCDPEYAEEMYSDATMELLSEHLPKIEKTAEKRGFYAALDTTRQVSGYYSDLLKEAKWSYYLSTQPATPAPLPGKSEDKRTGIADNQ